MNLILKMHKIVLQKMLLLIILFSTTSVNACLRFATTPLETIYCEVRDKGYGKNLPDFHQFRASNLQTQRLLLKTPARQAGIQLPQLESTSAKSKTSTEKPGKSDSAEIGQQKQLPTQRTEARTPIREVRFTPELGESLQGKNCSLKDNKILCLFNDETHEYRHQINQPNSELAANALTDANQLIIENPEHGTSAQSIQNKLAEAYRDYVNKMLTIGLAESVMSFTKFYASYEEIQAQGLTFSDRIAQMFELLKLERQSRPVEPRYSDNFPKDLQGCMFLAFELVVCDNVMQAWVYRNQD